MVPFEIRGSQGGAALSRTTGSKSEQAGGEVAGRTVLLADDEDLLREITALTLRRAGYVVLEAANSEAALGIAEGLAEKVDLLVTDIRLPEIGGISLFERLRTSISDLKVVFISGSCQEDICHTAQFPRGAAFLEKPFENSALLLSVHEALS